MGPIALYLMGRGVWRIGYSARTRWGSKSNKVLQQEWKQQEAAYQGARPFVVAANGLAGETAGGKVGKSIFTLTPRGNLPLSFACPLVERLG